MRFGFGVDISPTRTVTPEGYLICHRCRIARIGGREYTPEEIKEVKPTADGKITVIRSADSLFSPETIASFEGKPVSLQHPPGVEMFDANTWKQWIVGVMLHVAKGQGEDAGCLVADLILYDPTAINAVMSGELTELSLGYRSKVNDIGNGTGVESPLIGNHVALVPKGRCGSLCAIKDAKPEGEKMFPFKKDADPTGNASAEAIKALQEQINALQEQLASLKPTVTVTDGDPQTADDQKKDDDVPSNDPPKDDEPKQDDQTVEPQKTDEPKQDDIPTADDQVDEWKPTKEGIAQIVLEVLKAQAQMTNAPQQTVVDECVKKDAATIAPNLDANTPNLALKAIEAYAKTENGKQIVEAHGGMSVIKDSAESFLKSIAIAERARALASIGEGKKDAKAEPRPSYFTMAKNIWKNKEI